MRDDTPPQGNELDTEAREVIAETCARHDFPIAGAHLDGEILKLTPKSLEDLPDARKLDAIADDLDDGGYRYVTFVVPEDEPDGDAR